MNDAGAPPKSDVATFIDHWSKSSGLDVPEPDPARGDVSLDIYTFEYGVKFKEADGAESNGRVDLYK